MFNVNALFEAWLREATQKPLASWKRAALLWRLQEDEELRCYAAELAQFSHEAEPTKGLGQSEQAWMRQRLRAQLEASSVTAADGYWQGAWTGPVIGLALGLGVLGLVLLLPERASLPGADQNTQSSSSEKAAALALPTVSPTVSPSATKTPVPTDEPVVEAQVTLTAVP